LRWADDENLLSVGCALLDPHYRIKSTDEAFERVAKEHELAYRSE
jgi:hypothetical protein